VVGALSQLCERDDLFGEVLNIGSTEEVSMLELADRVKAVTGSESEIALVSYEEAYGEGFEDMQRRVPDLSKIGAALGWRPTASLEEILRDVVEFELSLNPLAPHGASLGSP
jgi:UDP-glucose 4-epimerase